MATFRLAKRDDVSQLRSLDTVSAAMDQIGGKKCFVLRRKGILEYFLKCKGILVAEDEGRIVGYVLAHPVEWIHGISKLVWIEHIGVHPDHRRRGIGLGMLKFVRRHYRTTARCLHAEIHPLNQRSVRMFRKFGVELVERKLAFKKL